jgi:hypothetical protein
MKNYTEGYQLAENEFLLKKRGDNGYMTKMTQKGAFPKAFEEWGSNWRGENPNLPVYIVEEVFREGWKINGWRFGQSRNWAELMHPLGYTVEVHMEDFLELLKEITVVNGQLQGSFKWNDKELVRG